MARPRLIPVRTVSVPLETHEKAWLRAAAESAEVSPTRWVEDAVEASLTSPVALPRWRRVSGAMQFELPAALVGRMEAAIEERFPGLDRSGKYVRRRPHSLGRFIRYVILQALALVPEPA